MNRIKDGESMGEIVVWLNKIARWKQFETKTTAPNKKTKAHTHIHTKWNKHKKNLSNIQLNFIELVLSYGSHGMPHWVRNWVLLSQRLHGILLFLMW